MGKTKQKKKHLADTVRSKKQKSSVKANPFEVKINRQKHDVLGRRLGKFDKGRPGVSRNKAMVKRKATLLVEYQQRHKTNRLVDRRIGENDATIPLEEKMLQRFAMEKQKSHEKASLFRLEDEADAEELTHYGQSLADIEKFEDPISDSDDEDVGKISANIVGAEHFGGFLTKKAERSDGEKKSWKQKMEELIAKSRKARYERQSEKEKNIELTDQLDKEWKESGHQLLASLAKKKDQEETGEAKKSDDFDIMVRELLYESKGKASDRLKTDEEIAKEEKDRLDKLEADRQRRMRGEDVSQPVSVHRSADDLDDGFLAQTGGPRKEVRYQDGVLIKSDEEEGAESEDDDDNDDDNDDDDDEADSDDKGSGDDGNHDDDSEDDEDESCEDGMEGGSDLDSSEDEVEEAVTVVAAQKPLKSALKKRLPQITHESLPLIDEKDRAKLIESAKQELPYTFEVPASYEDFVASLDRLTPSQQLTVIERTRKCNHPSLAEGNKAKLQTFFSHVLLYFGDLALHDPPQLTLINQLVPQLYKLAQLSSPSGCAAVMREVIKEHHQQVSETCDSKSGRCSFPPLDTLLYLKLVSVLYPTSDFKHPVVTPAILLMCQLLTKCRVSCVQDVYTGLFICNLVLEYVTYSKRYVPEVVNFLCGVLSLASDYTTPAEQRVLPPFKPAGPHVSLLNLQSKQSRTLAVKDSLGLCEVFSPGATSALDTDCHRISCLSQCHLLLLRFTKLYLHLPSASEIFHPVKYFCRRLSLKKYPVKIKESTELLLEQIAKAEKHVKTQLCRQKSKPPIVRQLEPKIEENFDVRKKRGVGTKEAQTKQRLKHRYKREMKGAIREVKKDAQFLARHKLNETIERDADRKRKVKEIYAQLADQEGDFKALKRKKDKI